MSGCESGRRIILKDLRCENLENPVAIDNTHPHFSWKIETDGQTMRQAYFEIQVATDSSLLAQGKPDLWNSGKVESSASVMVPYRGKELRSSVLAYWKVRVWDDKGESSDWSPINRFGIGLLDKAEWQGKYIGMPDAFESESYDRKDMKLPACQNHLIEEVAKVQPNLVVVLHNGSPVEAPWAEQTAAILELYLGGQGVGEACDRLLYGQANPSGRLAESFPLRIEDNPSYLSFGGDGKKVDYTEGVYVGYRYYEAKKQPVRWAFGHGLSYTEFKYDHLTVSSKELDDENEIIVEVDVTNVGACAGKEVVQLYVADKNGTVNRPVKELKGFTKLFLQPRETKKAQMKISARDLSFYNEEIKDWYASSGTYEILIGHASDDIRISCEVSFTTKKQLPFQVTGTTTIGELLADSRTAAATMELLAPLQQNGENGEEISEADQQMIQAILEGLPLKSLSIAGVTGETIEGIIYKLNELC